MKNALHRMLVLCQKCVVLMAMKATLPAMAMGTRISAPTAPGLLVIAKIGSNSSVLEVGEGRCIAPGREVIVNLANSPLKLEGRMDKR